MGQLDMWAEQELYELGKRYCKEAQYEVAAVCFYKAAIKEHAKAQYELAMLYRYGLGVPYSQEKAAEWLKKAAVLDYIEAQYMLGQCYYYGNGVEQSNKKAAGWYINAAAKGHERAKAELAELHYYGEGVEKNHKIAILLGYAEALYQLGEQHYKANGDVEKEIAAMWFEKAACQEHAAAQYMLGKYYHHGHGVQMDINEAVKWYQKATEQEYQKAKVELGNLYYHGLGVEQDKEKASELGCVEAQFEQAARYLHGDGVEKNMQKAFECYQKAAEGGYVEAQFELGNCYFRGKGIELDEEKAVEWYRKAAENNHIEAQCALGECYWKGKGVEKDLEKAIDYFLEIKDKSVNAKVKLAILAKMNFKGIGDYASFGRHAEHMEKIFFELVKELKKESKNGHPEAIWGYAKCWQSNMDCHESYERASKLGCAYASKELGDYHYEKYKEGKSSIEEVAKWYELAIEQGSGEACYALAKMYDFREGAELCHRWDKDLLYVEKVIPLYRQAARLGCAEAQYELSGSSATSKEEAVKLCQRAINQGHLDAMCRMGEWYECGIKVEYNAKAAIKYWEKAAAEKHLKALGYLFRNYYHYQDKEKTFYWAKLAAEAGVVEAQSYLAFTRDSELYRLVSAEERRMWTERAAEGGDAIAQLCMADRTEGSEKKEWLLKATNQGNLHAMKKLGYFYKDDPYEKNYKEAIKWFEKLRESANKSIEDEKKRHPGIADPYKNMNKAFISEAYFEMAEMYEVGGYGIEQDLKEALHCYEMGSDHHITHSKIRIKELKERLKK